MKLHTSERYCLFLSFENLSTDRLLSFLMHFLNLTCPVLKFSQNFSAVSYKTVSYNRILRVCKVNCFSDRNFVEVEFLKNSTFSCFYRWDFMRILQKVWQKRSKNHWFVLEISRILISIGFNSPSRDVLGWFRFVPVLSNS